MTRYIHRLAVRVIFEVFGAQCDTLIEHHVRTDDSRLANHHSRSMVDTEVVAYLSRRVNIYTRTGVCQLGQHTGNTWNA